MPEAKILTISDSVAMGTKPDLSGPALAQNLRRRDFDVIEQRFVSDGLEPVASALVEMAEGFSGLIVTTGGTGFSPRDQTPEGTSKVLDRQAPGLAEAMRNSSPRGRLTRGVAGTIGQAVVINTPGSAQGATEFLDAVVGILPHAVALLAGKPDPHDGQL